MFPKDACVMLCAYLPAAAWKQHKDIVKSLRKANVDRQEKIEEKKHNLC